MKPIQIKTTETTLTLPLAPGVGLPRPRGVLVPLDCGATPTLKITRAGSSESVAVTAYAGAGVWAVDFSSGRTGRYIARLTCADNCDTVFPIQLTGPCVPCEPPVPPPVCDPCTGSRGPYTIGLL